MGATPPTNYKMSDVVNKLLRPSLTSYYHVDVALPSNGDLKKFLEFRLPVDSALFERISLSCSEASLPGSSIATHEVNNDYPGVSEKMAYRRLYDDRIDFTFYVDHDYSIIEFFEGWMNYVVGEGVKTEVKLPKKGTTSVGFSRDDYKNRNAFYRMTYPEYYKTDQLFITKFERDVDISVGKTLVYQFINAFPISITSMPVSYDSSQLLKCTVSFSYSRFVRSTTSNINNLPPTANPYFGPAYGPNQNLYALQQANIPVGPNPPVP